MKLKLKLLFAVPISMAAFLFISVPASNADEYSVAIAKYSEGKFAEALAHFNKAAQAQPKSWKVQYQLANTHLQLKDVEKAKKSYQKCLSLNPPADAKANCQRAIAYLNNPTPPASTQAYRPSMYMNSSSRSSAPPADSAGVPAADKEKEMARARITREGEAEIARMKAEEEERLQSARVNANQQFRLEDGTVRYQLSDSEEAEFKKETARKEAAIRERMQRQLNAIR